MSDQYQLSCDCGKTYPVEISQAGQSIQCECGKSIQIPSMLKMKKLPLWLNESQINSDKADQNPDQSDNNQNFVPSESNKEEKVLSGSRLGIFIIGLSVVLLGGWFFLRTISWKPHPLMVFTKQIMFANGDKYVHRNSTPVTQDDYEFYLFNNQFDRRDYIINDNVIDFMMTPIDNIIYLENFKKGLELSENFYENYDEIKYFYKVKLVATIIFIILGLATAISPWFMPKKKKIVRTMRGTDWVG